MLKERKIKRRRVEEMERGGSEKTGDKQEGEGRSEGEIKEPQQQRRGKRNPP